MYKRNVPLIIIISILILMLALVSWQLLKINNTFISLQQQIVKAALVKGVLRTNGLNHTLWFTLIVILLSAMGVYIAEPETVKTFENALWWSFVTATTVGYGDIFPTSQIASKIGSASCREIV